MPTKIIKNHPDILPEEPELEEGKLKESQLPPPVVSESAGSHDVVAALRFHVPPVVDGVATQLDPSKARARNAPTPLTIPSYDGSGQNVEPSVLHLPGGFVDGNGATWYYLMVVAGYKEGNPEYENPQIRGSIDGREWSKIAGAPDPLVSKPAPEGAHNFDQSIARGPDGKIYVTLFQTGVTPGKDRLVYISSGDLKDWGNGAGAEAALTEIWETTSAELRYNTANIQWDGERWHMWAIRFVGGSALLHWTAQTLVGMGSAAPTECAITIPAARYLWESNIIRVAGLWVGLITTSKDESGGTSYLHLMTSPDGDTWNLEAQPILRPAYLGAKSAWDAGQVYRAALASLSGPSDARLGIWYSASDGSIPSVWKVGYTEAWFAPPAPAGSAARGAGAIGGSYFGGALCSGAAAATLGLDDLYLSPFYTGEDGIYVQRLGAYSTVIASEAVIRCGIYRINDQGSPFAWTAGAEWATLLAEAGTLPVGETAAFHYVLFPGGLVYLPPRTWFAIAGACQGAATTVHSGIIGAGVPSPLGAGNGISPYASAPYCALVQESVVGELPVAFVPAVGVANDSGVVYQASPTQPNF